MATKARLHWFWRGMITIPLAGGCNLLILLVALRLMQHATPSTLIMTVLMSASLPGMVIYGLLGRWLDSRESDGELHCRRCDHILRGLSEPRCPECGEAI